MVEATQTEDRVRDGRIRWWDLIIAFFGGNFLGIVISVLAATVALVIAMTHGYRASPQNLLAFSQNSFWANHVALVLSDLGLGITIWFVAWRRMARPLAHYFAPTGTMAIVWAALSGVALSVLLNGTDTLLERMHLVKFEDSPVERAPVPHDPVQLVATLVVVGLFAPFVEEFFFRGIFFEWARRKMGAYGAAAVTALAFALAHGHLILHPGAQGWIYTGELFVAGAVLAAWVGRTNSLRTSWATHAAYNAAAIVFSVILP